MAEYRRTVDRNEWIPKDVRPHPKQRYFLLVSDCLEVLFGGAAGGGKSAALLMAALQYVDVPGYSALLLRRTFRDLNQPDSLIPKSKEWLYGRADWNAIDKRWTFPSGATVTFGYCDHEDDVYQYQGAAFQTICFDELTQFTEPQYLYLFSRLRKREGVNVPLRVRAASNPGGVGHQWVKKRFISEAGKDADRLFVPATLADNPSLNASEYHRSLAQLDEVLRRQLLGGDWDAGNDDDPFQVIPTAWVRAAMDRWKGEGGECERKLSSVGVDVARGGKDATVIARRYGGRFVVEKVPGTSTPNGPAVVTLLAKSVAENPQALLCIDVIGVGASVYDLCAQKGWRAFAVNFAEGARGAKDRSGTLEFANVRAFAYWSLRELLDPSSATPISLPPDPELLTDLTSPRWQMGPTGVRIEPKEEIKKRIGRSPDAGDAVACAILYPASLAGGRAAGPSALRA